jgi:hypothetical protein
MNPEQGSEQQPADGSERGAVRGADQPADTVSDETCVLQRLGGQLTIGAGIWTPTS